MESPPRARDQLLPARHTECRVPCAEALGEATVQNREGKRQGAVVTLVRKPAPHNVPERSHARRGWKTVPAKRGLCPFPAADLPNNGTGTRVAPTCHPAPGGARGGASTPPGEVRPGSWPFPQSSWRRTWPINAPRFWRTEQKRRERRQQTRSVLLQFPSPAAHRGTPCALVFSIKHCSVLTKPAPALSNAKAPA